MPFAIRWPVALRVLVFILPLFLVLSSCEQDPDPLPGEEETGNLLTTDQAWLIMDQFYLWNETMPVINPDDYGKPQDVLEALRNEEYDRFSYIETTEEFLNYYQSGIYIGHGFSLKYDEEGLLRVAFVYDDAPADVSGVQRGWSIKSINGTAIEPFSDYFDLLGADQAGVENTYVFVKHDSSEVELTIDKQEVDIKTILHQEIMDLNGTPTGYLVFNHFISPAIEDLNEAFNEFSEAGVEEFILDLRYNRGGMEQVYMLLAGLIGGSTVDDQVITKYIHNSKNTGRNVSLTATSYTNSIDIDRIVFITTRSSASASELIINGMKPYFDVTTVGDYTYGKPVGMYSFQYDDLTMVPICFKYVNANDEGDFFDGIAPDIPVADDLTRRFGDPEEACLKAALEYLETGSTVVTGLRKAATVRPPEFLPPGLKFEIGAI